MDNVTVACACGRMMRVLGSAPRGTFTCGCGARVRVTVDLPAMCAMLGDDGQRCRKRPIPASESLRLALCAEHLLGFAQAASEGHLPVLAEARERMALAERQRDRLFALWHQDAVQARGGTAEERSAGRARLDWVVYYVRTGDLIKIGTTSQYWDRMRTLVPDDLLAWEAGGHALEASRHSMFADLRMHGERFVAAEPLLGHIAQLRKANGRYPDIPGARPAHLANLPRVDP